MDSLEITKIVSEIFGATPRVARFNSKIIYFFGLWMLTSWLLSGRSQFQRRGWLESLVCICAVASGRFSQVPGCLPMARVVGAMSIYIRTRVSTPSDISEFLQGHYKLVIIRAKYFSRRIRSFLKVWRGVTIRLRLSARIIPYISTRSETYCFWMATTQC